MFPYVVLTAEQVIKTKLILDMRKFDYVMFFAIYGKKRSGVKMKIFFTKYGQKITSQGSKHYVIRLTHIKNKVHRYSRINLMKEERQLPSGFKNFRPFQHDHLPYSTL